MRASSGHYIGIILGLAAAAFFGVSHSVVVLAYNGGSNPLSVSATRFILPIIILLAFLSIRRRKIFMPGRFGALAIVLGLVTAVYTLALLLSLDFLPAGIAILVFYLFPIFTGIIVAIMGRAQLDRKTSWAALVAILGLGLALGLRFDDYSPAGIALAVVAALGLAVVSAYSVRVIVASDPLRATVYMSVGALVCLGSGLINSDRR